MPVESPVRLGPEALPATADPSLPALVVFDRRVMAGLAWFAAENSTADSRAAGRMLLGRAARPEQMATVSYALLLIIVVCRVQKFRCRSLDRGTCDCHRLLLGWQELHLGKKFVVRRLGWSTRKLLRKSIFRGHDMF